MTDRMQAVKIVKSELFFQDFTMRKALAIVSSEHPIFTSAST